MKKKVGNDEGGERLVKRLLTPEETNAVAGANSSGEKDYEQNGGNYTQNTGGNHLQTGGGNYTQGLPSTNIDFGGGN